MISKGSGGAQGFGLESGSELVSARAIVRVLMEAVLLVEVVVVVGVEGLLAQVSIRPDDP